MGDLMRIVYGPSKRLRLEIEGEYASHNLRFTISTLKS
jgi:hypothetical protein